MALYLQFVKMINIVFLNVSHNRQGMTSEDKFTEAIQKYVLSVTPHVKIFLNEIHELPEIQNLSLAMKTVLFSVVGRWHHEMQKGINSGLHPLEAYNFAINQIVNDPHVNDLMTTMMSTGVNATVNNIMEF